MIRKIEIEGYRLLDGFAADLGQLTVVIGANAVGKSTLLDCLQLIGQCAEFPLNTVLGWHWGLASVLTAGKTDNKLSWRISLRKPMAAYWQQVPLPDDCALEYAVDVRGDQIGQGRPLHESLTNPEPAPGFTFLDATPYSQTILARNGQLMPFDAAATPPSAVRETSSDRPATPSNGRAARVQEPALLLSQIRFFNDFPVPAAVRVLLANMAFYPGFDVTRLSALRTKAAEIKPVSTLGQNGENLGTVLHEILTRGEFRGVAEELREFLRAAYPQFEDLRGETTFGAPPQLLVRVYERGVQRPMEIWELSDGVLRFLCLAAALLNPVSPPFVAVDEPELGLHPRLMPIIGDMIKTAAERTQVLVTTHSPDLLNCFDLDNVAVMSRWEEGTATWNRPSDRPTLREMLNDVAGETLGDLHRSGELEMLE